MTDQEARNGLAEASVRIEILETQLAWLHEAYDELFDFLAEELGFRAKMLGEGGLILSPYTPRRLARTTPPSEVLRVPVKLKPKKAREGP